MNYLQKIAYRLEHACLATTALFCLFFGITTGCRDVRESSEHPPPTSQSDALVQVSTIDAILGGLYGGVMDFETLKRHGDFGIGTFDGLDGEMAGFDGNFYQVQADGIAYPVSDSMRTPFATITFFDVDHQEIMPGGLDYTGTREFLDSTFPTENIFYAIKITGTFSYMKTRSVPRQSKPYPPLIEVTRTQPEFDFNDIQGTLVGYRCPDYISGINAPGYHLHFIAEDAGTGGHVLDFKIAEGMAFVDYVSEFSLMLPDKESGFYRLDLTQDRQAELEEAEK